MAVRPLVNRRIIEALLDAEMRKATDRRLLLVNARYEDTAPKEFTARIDGLPRHVHVTDEDSVLGIVDAWQRHLAERATDRLLVVTSGVTLTQLGWDLRAHAVGRRSLTVDRAEIVKQLFGATELDARMYRDSDTWLLDALLDAEPVGGWPRGDAVLTRDTAVRALVRVRLGLGSEAAGDPLDLDTNALLAWSRTTAGPTRFTELPAREREGLTSWLTETVGTAAPTLLALITDGRGQDAMALGVLGAALSAPGAPAVASFALGGLFGSALRSLQDLQPFTDAVTGTLARWIAEAESHTAQGAEAKQRVQAVVDRADRLAEEADLRQALRTDPLLPSAFKARLRDLAAALDESPRAARAALGQVLLHQLASLHPESCEAARMAVRMLHWLDEPTPAVESVAQAVGEHMRPVGVGRQGPHRAVVGRPHRGPVRGAGVPPADRRRTRATERPGRAVRRAARLLDIDGIADGPGRCAAHRGCAGPSGRTARRAGAAPGTGPGRHELRRRGAARRRDRPQGVDRDRTRTHRRVRRASAGGGVDAAVRHHGQQGIFADRGAEERRSGRRSRRFRGLLAAAAAYGNALPQGTDRRSGGASARP